MPVPDYREIEIPLSLASIKDHLEPLLYQLGYVKDDETILKLVFKKGICTEDFVNENNLIVPVLVKIKKQQEIVTINS